VNVSLAECARLVDLSAVWPNDDDRTIQALVECACRIRCWLVSTLPAQANLARRLLEAAAEAGAPPPHLGGNVGFPSGGQTTSIKVAETEQLLAAGCQEIDAVIDIAGLLSGRRAAVQAELRALVAAAAGQPLKAILECHYLTDDQIRTGCDCAIAAGAAFVKTGSGWAPTPTSPRIVALIKAHVGEAIGIKASGGIRSLAMIQELHRCGARRFGLGLRAAEQIFPAGVASPLELLP
jgi:deoxyribose-phosphate aldolase